MKEKVFEILDSIGVEYKNYEHEPVFTCEQAMSVELPGLRVKSLLIYNKKKTNFYMVVLPDHKKVNSSLLCKHFGERKMNFFNEDYLMNKVGLKPGHVSPFALINNSEKDIRVVFDESLKSQVVGFHPLRNDNTIILNLNGVEKFLEKEGFGFEYLDM